MTKNIFYTILYSFSTILIGMSLGLFLAVQVNKKIKAGGVFKVALFYPMMIPVAAAALIWLWMYMPTYGVLDYMLGGIGLHGFPWLNSTKTALWCIVAVGIWKHVGYYMILFLAGLTNIPNELNDAARVEGAGSWIRFWRITFPLLSSYTFFIFIINIVDSLQSIDLVYIMTQGRPADSTNLIVYYIYQQAFRYWNMGVGSTLTSMLTQATESSPEWSLTMAATIIVVAPLLLTFIIFQKRFIQSFMHSGLKG